MKRTLKCGLLLAVLLCLGLPVTVRAGMDLQCRSLEGGGLCYALYNTGETAARGTCVAAAYSEEGRLLDAKAAPFSIAGKGKTLETAVFDTDKVARVKVFALAEDTLAPLADDGIKAGESRREVYNFASPVYAGLGSVTQTVTAGGVRFNYTTKPITLQNGYAYLYGGGSLANCSITVTAKSPCQVRVTVESVDRVSQRTIRVADTQNHAIDADQTVTAKATLVYDYDGGGGELTLFSLSSGVNVYAVELVYQPEPEEEWQHLYVDSWEGVSQALSEAGDGATIHLPGGVVPCRGTLSLSGDRDLTICGSEEETTVLDFTAWSDELLNTPAEVAEKGIYVRGSGYTLKNFILQGVPGTGISFYGATCHHNRVENVVSRYNHNPGFSVTGGAANTTLVNCDAYRNCDLYKKGQDADGFAISVDCGPGTVLRNCRAFENGDDGYDNFNNHNDVTYLDCYCWNNGNAAVYTGQYDVAKGRPVDENLGLVRLLRRQSPAFAAALDEGRLELPMDAEITVRDTTDYDKSVQVTLGQYLTTVWEGNGNGFKLASGESKHGAQVTAETGRRLERCIAFDHPSKGFDRNGGVPTVDVTDLLSFGNYKNYWSDGLTLGAFQNVLGWGGTVRDTTDSAFAIQALSQAEGAAKAEAVYDRVAQLEALLAQDQIPGAFLIDPGW